MVRQLSPELLFFLSERLERHLVRSDGSEDMRRAVVVVPFSFLGVLSVAARLVLELLVECFFCAFRMIGFVVFTTISAFWRRGALLYVKEIETTAAVPASFVATFNAVHRLNMNFLVGHRLLDLLFVEQW